jgi:glucokinase
MILAGDIGGTKVQLALVERQGRTLRRRRTARFQSRRYRSLEAVLGEFLAGERKGRVRAACFGVAGPIVDGRCETPNLPWVIEERSLRRALGTSRVRLLNDLEAMAAGVLRLRPRDLATLQRGIPGREGNAAVIAAGTGLGQATLFWDGERHHPSASEGGHCDFAPRNREEYALLAYLQRVHGRVSYERVLSGPGLHAIYRFLRDTGRAREPRWLAREMTDRDPAAVISEMALKGRSALCARALDLFTSLYGAEAGNLALRAVAVRGLYVGGGIAPKILPKLRAGGFLRSFLSKGRMTPLLKTFPVHVILNQETPLLGAAGFAASLR